MHYPMLRESRVVIWDNGRAFCFDALSSYSSTTSYEEYKTTRRTLHKRTNYAYSKIVAKDATSISLNVNFTNSYSELALFEWLGLDRFNNSFILPKYSSNIEPKMVDVYLTIKGGESILFSKCFLSTIDFTFDRSVPVLIVGLESGDFNEYSNPPSPSIYQGDVLPFYPGSASVNSAEIPGFISAAVSLQQQCSWREDRNIHGIGSVYHNTRAIVNELNCSAVVSKYFFKDISGQKELLPEYSPITIKNNNITVDFPLARITKRLEVADVFRVEYDIIPTEDSDPVIITFLEK